MAVFLLTVKQGARCQRQLPMPQPRPDASEQATRSAAKARWSVAAGGAAIGGLLFILSLGLFPALKVVFPALASQFVLLTLTTSIAAAISAYELTSIAKRIESASAKTLATAANRAAALTPNTCGPSSMMLR